MIFDLDLGTREKVLSQGIWNMKYESYNTYLPEVMANIKVFLCANRQTDKQTTICSRSIDSGA